jgi:MoxR-like ATPase
MDDVRAQVEAKNRIIEQIRTEIARVIIGQKKMVDRMLIGLLTRGHILIEGVPGLAKTTAVKALAGAIRSEFKRIQFTPDLLPADIVGTEVLNPKTYEFTVKKGPIFNNIILADEINRAPSKVQSALLEAMQERQITIGGQSFILNEPFLVLATQNPIEQEGTYPLPEAQVDRFMLKIQVDYPARSEEREMALRLGGSPPAAPRPVISPAQIAELVELVGRILMDERLLDYILDLVAATRRPGDFGLSELAGFIEYGASPRATLHLAAASRAYAFILGRAYVTPQDIKAVAPDVLRHRIILSYEAEAEDVTADEIIDRIFDAVEVP